MEIHVSGVKTTDSSLIDKSFVILPAYNEVESLKLLVPRIAQSMDAAHRLFEVIVVNDGSTDDTTRTVASFPSAYSVRELRHSINSGYGAAIKTGSLWVVEHAQQNDAIVTLDADNTQDPLFIPGLLNKLEEGFDAVTASYTTAGGHASGVPWMRRVMSKVLNQAFQWSIPLPGVQTYTNGFRAYRVSRLQAAHQIYKERLIEEPGFPGGTELFLKIAGVGGALAEIPFDLHYEHRGSGSKIHLGSTISKYLKLLCKGRRYACR